MSKNRTATVLVAVLLLLLGGKTTAWSKTEKKKLSGDFYLSGTVGSYHANAPRGLKGETFYGLKFGYDIPGIGIVDSLGIEGFAAKAQSEDKAAKVYQFRVDTIHPLRVKKQLTPFLALGGGWVNADEGSLVEDGVIFSLGFGVKYALTNYLMLRADFRDMIWFEPGQSNYLETSVGISYLFGQERIKKPVPPPDADRDGVADTQDSCPETLRGMAVDTQGCPTDTSDGDGDSVPDYRDWCKDTLPETPVDQDGCPKDSDGDTVPDFKDRCPGTPHGMDVDDKGCVKLSSSPTSSIPAVFTAERQALGEVAETAKVVKTFGPDPVASQGDDLVNPDLLPIEAAPVVMKEKPLIDLPVAAEGEVGVDVLVVAAVELPILVPETVSSPETEPVADASDENKADNIVGKESPGKSRPILTMGREETFESKNGVVAGGVGAELTPIVDVSGVMPEEPLIDLPVAAEGKVDVGELDNAAVEVPILVPETDSSPETEPVIDAPEKNEADNIVGEEGAVESRSVLNLPQDATDESKGGVAAGAEGGGDPAADGAGSKPVPLKGMPVVTTQETPVDLPAVAESGFGDRELAFAAVEVPILVPTTINPLDAQAVAKAADVKQAMNDVRRESRQGASVEPRPVLILPREAQPESEEILATAEAGATDTATEAGQPDAVGRPDMVRVEFGFDRSEVKEGFRAQLTAIAERLKVTQEIVRIEGHTDSLGSHAYNDSLSQKRAESVKRDLQALGGDSERIVAVGYGERRPIADNSTESGRQKNRRALIVFQDNQD